MYLPKNAEFIINSLKVHGYDAYAVGGCVRDHLLGKTAGDYDLTTSATPEQMKAVFSDCYLIETGIKHGTLTLLLDSVPYEITTYRIDGKYNDSRHPEYVSFTRNITEDLARRDFTVNAIAYNPHTGFVDPFGGMKDIEIGVIRTVGDPTVRFTEDALRIMRALRFSAVLGFRIEENTAMAMREKKNLISKVSRERIYAEWKKLISGKDSYRVLSEYRNIIEYIIPWISGYKLPDESVFLSADGDVRELSLFVTEPYGEASLRFAEAMRYLKTDSAHIETGISILARLSCPVSDRISVHVLLADLKEKTTEKFIKLKILLGDAKENCLDILKGLLEEGACYKISDLKIDGNDLLALGYKGRKIGETLERLLLSVSEEKIENERESLLTAITKK